MMYAVLDIETTGGKYNEEGITEIAIHRFDGHQVTDRFISLVNPEKEIQPFVVKLTGINTKMLRQAPKFHEVAKRIVEITEDTVLIAHNAQFDYRILRTEFRRLGYNFERKTLCTVELAQKLLPDAESYSLGKLVRSLGIAVSDRHRANGDALATLKLFKLLLDKDSEKAILKTVVRAETLGELSPRQLDMVANVPAETGVYYMHNKDGDILFLGKSTNMKKSVNQHFTKSGGRARRLQKETKKITFEKTGSELAAQLKEYEELRRNHPKYNPRPKRRLYSHVLYQVTEAGGRRALRVGPADAVKEEVLTTFNSMQGARNFLDDLPLAQDIPGQAIADHSLNGKNIVIVDKGREIGEYCAILVQKGQFKGFGYYGLNHQINNIPILETLITPMKGDSNTKHIIESYLRKRKVIKIVELQSD